MGTYLLGSIGLPGSGKSTFLSRFASEQGFFYWQNDEARRRMFGHPRYNAFESDLLGHASKYVFEQLLSLGQSSIYDVNLNRRYHRDQLTRLAGSYGAEFWLLWFRVPMQVSQERVLRRAQEATGPHKDYYKTFRPDLVEHMASRLELPETGEHVIEIDGAASYENQLSQVVAKLDFT